MTDPLQCTFEDARRQHLRDGIAMSTAAKIAWFEEMVTLAVRFGAVDRLRDRPESAVVDRTHSEPDENNENPLARSDRPRAV
jgi:hypothetical protein